MLTKEEIETLGRYNRQVEDEGLVHTGKWILKMHKLQKEFNKGE